LARRRARLVRRRQVDDDPSDTAASVAVAEKRAGATAGFWAGPVFRDVRRQAAPRRRSGAGRADPPRPAGRASAGPLALVDRPFPPFLRGGGHDPAPAILRPARVQLSPSPPRSIRSFTDACPWHRRGRVSPDHDAPTAETRAAYARMDR